jgi:signal transduction histidine kinase
MQHAPERLSGEIGRQAMTRQDAQSAEPVQPDYLARLLELGQVINSSLELSQVLETAIDHVVAFVGAERGFILLVDTETGRVWGESLRNVDKQALEGTLSGRDPHNRAEISRTIVEQVLSVRQPVLSHNAMEDPRFAGRESVQLSNLRSVIAVPLATQGRLLGLIYLDNRAQAGLFTERELAILSAFANQASVAIENARLYQNLRRSLEERLRLQEELHKQEVERLTLEEASRLKSDFVGIVAHELRNPLTAIRGYTQTLLQDVEFTLPKETVHEFYETIEADTDRLLDMIDELLDISRLESGRPLHPALTDVELAPLIERLARRTRLQKGFTSRHRLRTEMSPDLPATIVADENKLNQILSNLLTNAVKYSPEGGEVVLRAAPDGPNHVRIEVQDPGIGLSEDQIARLFNRYERIERPEIENIPGTGLGLFLVKHLVDMHGGEIACSSEPGKGSLFTVRLPVAGSPTIS